MHPRRSSDIRVIISAYRFFRLFREILLRLDKPSSNSSFSAALSKPSKGILIESGVRQPAVQA
jgi:hypothetical protein